MENSVGTGRNEKLFDALFDIAADEALKEETDALPSCEELNKLYPRTKSLDKKVFAAINREAGVVKRRAAVLAFAKIAAGFIIGLAVSTSAIIFNSELQESLPSDVPMLVFGHIPYGFNLATSQYTFEDDTGQYFTVGRVSEGLVDDNTFEQGRTGIQQQGAIRYLYDERTIVWNVGEYTFTITAFLDYETLTAIAENISVK